MPPSSGAAQTLIRPNPTVIPATDPATLDLDLSPSNDAAAGVGAAIEIRGLTRLFGDGTGLHPADLEVGAGEFLSVLGPSGCGKSTLLRCLAGLESPQHGSIRFGDRVIYDGERGDFIPTRRREIGMVFQDLALWPHMNATDNVAFPLRVARIAKAALRERVNEALALVGLSEFASKMPHQLSGGQQQRVAIARAIVARPRVLLMDEPFSALDAALRLQLRNELRTLTRSLGLTTVYVTHDQAEAMSMSDRIAVLDRGTIAQVATPEMLYLAPATRFVANFIGQCNWLPGQEDMGVRPEHISIRSFPEDIAIPDHLILDATVTDCIYIGGSYFITAVLDDTSLPWSLTSPERIPTGDRIQMSVPREHIIRVPRTP